MDSEKKSFAERLADKEIKAPSVIMSCDAFYPTVDEAVLTVHNYAARLSSVADFSLIVPDADIPDVPYGICRAKSHGNLLMPGYRIPTGKISDADRAILESGKFQIVHSHSPFAVGEKALKTGKKLGIPVVATFHSKYCEDAKRISGSYLVTEAVRHKVVRYYSSCDAVWTVNNPTAETLRDYGYKGKITVMENGCDRTVPRDSLELIRSVAGKLSMPTVGKYPKILLFVGQLIWQKDLKLILDTLSLLVSAKSCGGDDCNYILLVAGTGYNEKEIRRYAEKLGLSDRVRFLGRVDDRDFLSGLYGLADLLFFPSRYDNAPLAVREAAVMGTPSLLTAGSNAADGIRDGENGYTTEPDSLMMAAKISDIFNFSNPREVGLRAQETIPVDWDDILLRAVEEYNEIIGRYKKQHG